MITHRPADGQRPARRDGQQPDPPDYLARTDAELRRERIARRVDAIQRARPAWSRMTPWEAERLIERGADKQQRELFAEGGTP